MRSEQQDGWKVFEVIVLLDDYPISFYPGSSELFPQGAPSTEAIYFHPQSLLTEGRGLKIEILGTFTHDGIEIMENQCQSSELGRCGLHNDFYHANGDAIWMPDVNPNTNEPMLTARRVNIPIDQRRHLQGTSRIGSRRLSSVAAHAPTTFSDDNPLVIRIFSDEPLLIGLQDVLNRMQTKMWLENLPYGSITWKLSHDMDEPIKAIEDKASKNFLTPLALDFDQKRTWSLPSSTAPQVRIYPKANYDGELSFEVSVTLFDGETGQRLATYHLPIKVTIYQLTQQAVMHFKPDQTVIPQGEQAVLSARNITAPGESIDVSIGVSNCAVIQQVMINTERLSLSREGNNCAFVGKLSRDLLMEYQRLDRMMISFQPDLDFQGSIKAEIVFTGSNNWRFSTSVSFEWIDPLHAVLKEYSFEDKPALIDTSAMLSQLRRSTGIHEAHFDDATLIFRAQDVQAVIIGENIINIEGKTGLRTHVLPADIEGIKNSLFVVPRENFSGIITVGLRLRSRAMKNVAARSYTMLDAINIIGVADTPTADVTVNSYLHEDGSPAIVRVQRARLVDADGSESMKLRIQSNQCDMINSLELDGTPYAMKSEGERCTFIFSVPAEKSRVASDYEIKIFGQSSQMKWITLRIELIATETNTSTKSVSVATDLHTFDLFWKPLSTRNGAIVAKSENDKFQTQQWCRELLKGTFIQSEETIDSYDMLYDRDMMTVSSADTRRCNHSGLGHFQCTSLRINKRGQDICSVVTNIAYQRSDLSKTSTTMVFSINLKKSDGSMDMKRMVVDVQFRNRRVKQDLFIDTPKQPIDVESPAEFLVSVPIDASDLNLLLQSNRRVRLGKSGNNTLRLYAGEKSKNPSEVFSLNLPASKLTSESIALEVYNDAKVADTLTFSLGWQSAGSVDLNNQHVYQLKWTRGELKMDRTVASALADIHETKAQAPQASVSALQILNDIHEPAEVLVTIDSLTNVEKSTINIRFHDCGSVEFLSASMEYISWHIRVPEEDCTVSIPMKSATSLRLSLKPYDRSSTLILASMDFSIVSQVKRNGVTTKYASKKSLSVMWTREKANLYSYESKASEILDPNEPLDLNDVILMMEDAGTQLPLCEPVAMLVEWQQPNVKGIKIDGSLQTSPKPFMVPVDFDGTAQVVPELGFRGEIIIRAVRTYSCGGFTFRHKHIISWRIGTTTVSAKDLMVERRLLEMSPEALNNVEEVDDVIISLDASVDLDLAALKSDAMYHALPHIHQLDSVSVTWSPDAADLIQSGGMPFDASNLPIAYEGHLLILPRNPTESSLSIEGPEI